MRGASNIDITSSASAFRCLALRKTQADGILVTATVVHFTNIYGESRWTDAPIVDLRTGANHQGIRTGIGISRTANAHNGIGLGIV